MYYSAVRLLLDPHVNNTGVLSLSATVKVSSFFFFFFLTKNWQYKSGHGHLYWARAVTVNYKTENKNNGIENKAWIEKEHWHWNAYNVKSYIGTKTSIGNESFTEK